MAKVELEDPIKLLAGKVSPDGQIMYRTRYGKVHTYMLRNPRKRFSERERASHLKNGEIMREACAIVKDPARWATYAEGWEREGKQRYSKPRYYVQAQLGLNKQ